MKKCEACGGRTWVGEPWNPDACPECVPRRKGERR